MKFTKTHDYRHTNHLRYIDMLKHLTKEAKRLGCGIADLTYDYEGAPYDFVW